MSKKDDLLCLLSDGKLHSNEELAQITFRFGAILHNLRQEGYQIETIKEQENGLYSYRLISAKKEVK